MKIFISHSSIDTDAYEHLFRILSEMGHDVLDGVGFNVGELWIDKLKETFQETDALIALISESFMNSTWSQAELSSVLFGDNRFKILPIIIGDVFIPSYLNGIPYLKVDTWEEITFHILDRTGLFKAGSNNQIKSKDSIEQISNNPADNVTLLRNALKDNRLTLVCGAGVSVASGIPSWNELLVDILNDVFNSTTNSTNVLPKDLLAAFPQSNLILGKYLKLLLHDNFEKEVQRHLYKKYNQSDAERTSFDTLTGIMKAIVDIARPKRTGKRLESIITFNFDDLIEQALTAYGIDFCPIWEDGQTHCPEELPIYHVHGYLPNKTFIKRPNLVFSEGAYHSQFIDPYSWANLTQLNSYASNICLFIGLSLSDPNLRRLLDLSWRRNKRCKHYIIMKKLADNSVGKTATMLFELDAASLGLNVIWCSTYDEIPNLLNSIIK